MRTSFVNMAIILFFNICQIQLPNLINYFKLHLSFAKGEMQRSIRSRLGEMMPTKKPKPSQPLHINIKLIKGLPTLRAKNKFKLIKRAILKARVRGLRIIHFSIQSTHIHLLIESENKRELGRGMQSFCISLAKNLNGFLKRRGKVFTRTRPKLVS